MASQSKIQTTPFLNINAGSLVDKTKIETKTYDTYMDVFTFRNIKNNITWRGCLMHVSIYDDLIIEDGIEYKILSMLTKHTQHDNNTEKDN